MKKKHIISSCPKLSSPMYLTIRHNKVAKIIYDVLVCTEINKRPPIQEVYSNGHKEMW